jgi:hypothetical protein
LTIKERIADELDRIFVPWDKNLSLPTSEQDNNSLRGEVDSIDNLSGEQMMDVQSQDDAPAMKGRQSKKSRSTNHSRGSGLNSSRKTTKRTYTNSASLSTTLKDTLSKQRSGQSSKGRRSRRYRFGSGLDDDLRSVSGKSSNSSVSSRSKKISKKVNSKLPVRKEK